MKALDKTLDRLDALRARLVEEVRSHPGRARSRAPAPENGWTSTQVLQHLFLVEALVLADVEGSKAGARNGARIGNASDGPGEATIRRTLRDRVGTLAVWTVFRLGIRVRMPTRRVNPVPPLIFEEVEERWRSVGHDLARRLREAAATAPRRAVMRHPVSGPLSPERTAAFLLSHMRHHERQLHRILAAVPGPGAGNLPSPPSP